MEDGGEFWIFPNVGDWEGTSLSQNGIRGSGHTRTVNEFGSSPKPVRSLDWPGTNSKSLVLRYRYTSLGLTRQLPSPTAAITVIFQPSRFNTQVLVKNIRLLPTVTPRFSLSPRLCVKSATQTFSIAYN